MNKKNRTLEEIKDNLRNSRYQRHFYEEKLRKAKPGTVYESEIADCVKQWQESVDKYYAEYIALRKENKEAKMTIEEIKKVSYKVGSRIVDTLEEAHILEAIENVKSCLPETPDEKDEEFDYDTLYPRTAAHIFLKNLEEEDVRNKVSDLIKLLDKQALDKLAASIEALEDLQAMRKRPKMYYELENPNMGSEIIIAALRHALEMKPTEISIQIFSEKTAEISFNKALDTTLRNNKHYPRYPEEFITASYCGYGAGMKPGEFINYQMSTINAACEVFFINVQDQYGLWNQEFRKAKKETRFELIEKFSASLEPLTSLYISFDVDFFNEIDHNISIDRLLIKKWCKDNKVRFND